MDYSFKEKSIVASLGVTLLIFGWYLYDAFSNLSLNPELPGFVEIIIIIVWVAVLFCTAFMMKAEAFEGSFQLTVNIVAQKEIQ